MKKLWRKIKAVFADNLALEQNYLFTWAPFMFGLGIALYFALPTEPDIWITLGVFEVWILLFYMLRYKNLHAEFLLGLFIICGFLNIQARTLYQAKHIENFNDITVGYIRGRIKDISFSQKGKMRLLLENAENFDNPLKGNFRLTVMPEPNNVNIGQCVEMIATIFPREPLPVMNGYQLDRKYFYEGLSAIGYSNSETFVIDCPQKRVANSWREKINLLRQNLIRKIRKILPANQSGVAAALLFGEKTLIPTKITENYRNSGLAHFLAVSGLHLGTIAGLVFFLVRFLLALFPSIALRFDIKKVAAVIAIIFSAMYLLISGMAIPAQRAFVMTTVVLIGVICNRQAISLKMVSFAALAILIISPQALISMSFQMSFAAVYALVAFYENCKNHTTRQRGFLYTIWLYLSGIVICDLVASLATAPFALYHFHRLAIYTSLGNLLAGPLIGLVLMPFVLLCLICLPLNLAFYPLKALGFGIELLNNITDFVAHLPHSVWQTEALVFGGLVLIVCGGFWLCVWKGKWRYWGLVPIMAGILPLFFQPKLPDMVFSPQARDIAVRNDSGDLILLPRQNDAWTKAIWKENLQLKTLSKSEQNKINITDLSCTEEKCSYKNAIIFDANGNITVGHTKIDNSFGGYIFTGKKTYWRPLWNNQNCRPWQNCAAMKGVSIK